VPAFDQQIGRPPALERDRSPLRGRAVTPLLKSVLRGLDGGTGIVAARGRRGADPV
jgi:hypothetical protein